MSPAATREVFDVLSSTSILLLLVTGMAVIVGMMGVLNLCQGELVLLGALTTYLGYQWTGSALIGLLADLAIDPGAVRNRVAAREIDRRLTGEHHDLDPLGSQSPREMTAHKTRASCNRDTHQLLRFFRR